MTIQMIPLNQLVPSTANVRKTGGGAALDELAASIAALGLLQNLQVRPRGKDKFEVVAGGRRLAALKLLAKQKKIAKDSEIPCHILDAENATEVSLAENIVRSSMHPADQFAAFQALADNGKGPEEIAARFGVTAAVVRQRLKLGSVSPLLIALYRDEQMTLDQLMAFTVSDSHEAQEKAWFDQPDWMRGPSHIRRTLTAAHVEVDDARVRFVGMAAYQAAGGEIVRDLFEPEHEGYLTNPALLDKLVNEKLSGIAASVQAEGWRWVEIMPDLSWDVLRRYQQLSPQELPLTDEQEAELDSLHSQLEALTEEHGDDPAPEAADQMDALSDRIEAIHAKAVAWRPEDKAAAGVIVTIDASGNLNIERGLVRKQEGGGESGTADAAAKAPSDTGGLSAKLVEDLTAERTAALRALLADNQAVALAAVAHALALPVFYPHTSQAQPCLGLRLAIRDLRTSGECVASSRATALLDNRATAWLGRLPEAAGDLFGWLLAQDTDTLTALIAVCAAHSIDAVRGKQDRASSPRLAHADQLAEALGLDMAEWWEPTKERYLGRVPKALVLEAVARGISKQAAANLSTLKREPLVARAAGRLAGKGWLPEILRRPTAPEVAPLADAPEEELADTLEDEEAFADAA